MQISNTETVNPHPLSTTRDFTEIIYFDNILRDYNLSYRSTEFYWQVGNIKIDQGWVLHISVVNPQISALLRLLLPILLSRNVAFKIVRDSQIASQMLEGALGIEYQCKILAIYPNDNNHALHLAKEIIAITSDFKGPSIPNDRLIEGIVYTQFAHLNSQTKKETNSSNINDWPFQELRHLNISRSHKLLNSKYYPVSVIKRDSKGDVLKALYFKKPWKVSTCIIKQGRKCMLFDDTGRDVKDRLSWQYELHRQLAKHFIIPKAIDFFIENEDAYLVLEFIRGASFSAVIENVYMTDKWNSPSSNSRVLLTTHLLGIINIIQHLHEKGFVHRDITPDNFFIDRKNRVWLLDVELMWLLDPNKVTVPFQTGTPGFMSREQQDVKTPTINEDIYAVGALLFFVFTNVHPIKFAQSIDQQAITTLSFLFGSDKIAKVVEKCLSVNPHHRPNLGIVTAELQLYLEELQLKRSVVPETIKPNLYTPTNTILSETIQMAIHGLGHPSTLGPTQCWISNMISCENTLKNPQVGAKVYPGWHTGVAGPLWLLSIAHKNGFDIESCSIPYYESWNFIAKKYSTTHIDASLYTGAAGVALALSEALNSQLITSEGSELGLSKFFDTTAHGPTLSSGVAGQGIALLQASRWMEAGHSRQLLHSYVQFLLDRQRPDGSWDVVSAEYRKKRPELTLANGVPGIIWFLLHYLDVYPISPVLQSVIKACNWLLNMAFKKSNKYCPWPITNHSRSNTFFSTDSGIPGSLLVLIKAFKITGYRRYSDAASSSLQSLPDNPHFNNFTLGTGLAGIGELYLEAYKAFDDSQWLRRAGWIAQLFISSLQFRSSSDVYLIMEGEESPMADLFTGNAGAIHFLMHYLLPDKMHHPLTPYS